MDIISGRFVHAQNTAYQYRAQDDGGTLLLFVERAFADGGIGNDDGGTVISLERTPSGFVGATHAQVFTQRGARCWVSFPTEAVACGDGGLLIRAASSSSVDDQCRAAQNAPAAPKQEHRLVRVETPKPFEPDGGS